MPRKPVKKALIIFIIALLSVAAVVVTLPWWLPPAMVKDKITADIQRQFGREVTIESLSLSWNRGIEIRNLLIARHGNYGQGQMLRIDYLRCPFDLLGYMDNQLDWLYLEKAQLDIVADNKGKINIAELPDLEMNFGRVTFKQTRVNVINLQENETVPSMTLDLNGEFKQHADRMVNWSLKAYQQGQSQPVIISEGNISFSQTNRIASDMSQRGILKIDGLDLSRLPVKSALNAWLRQSPRPDFVINQWHGRCSLDSRFAMNENGHIIFEADMEIAKMKCTAGQSDQPPRILLDNVGMQVKANARYDPSAASVDITKLDFQIPGLQFSAGATFDLRFEEVQALEVSVQNGSVEPAKLLEMYPVLLSYPEIKNHLPLDGLRGQTGFYGRCQWQKPSPVVTFWTTLDLTGTHIAVPLHRQKSDKSTLFHKPPGDILQLNCDMDYNLHTHRPSLLKLYLMMLDTTLECDVIFDDLDTKRLPVYSKAIDWSSQAGEITLRLQSPDLSKLNPWYAPLAQLQTRGNIDTSINACWQFNPSFTGYLNSARIDGELALLMNQIPLSVQIDDLRFSDGRLRLPRLHTQIADNDMTIVADISNLVFPRDSALKSQTAKGKVFILSEQFDFDSVWQKLLAAAGTNHTKELQEIRTLPDDIRLMLLRCEVSGNAHIRNFQYTDPKTRSKLLLEQFGSSYDIKDDKINLTFLAGLNGGTINGRLLCDIAQSDPNITFQFDSFDLNADNAIRPMVESEFPGLELQGTVSEHYDLHNRLSCLLDPLCHWSGRGTTVCRDGLLYGTAGPDWIIKLFPELQLVRYRWQKMTNNFNSYANGIKKNHLVFKGKIYDVYMEGTTQPAHDPNQYQQAVVALKSDYLTLSDKLRDLENGIIALPDAKAERLRRKVQGLNHLWQRRQKQERLNVTIANYVVGGLISVKVDEIFDKPEILLHIPIFRSQGYIIDQYMVGIKNTNVSATE